MTTRGYVAYLKSLSYWKSQSENSVLLTTNLTIYIRNIPISFGRPSSGEEHEWVKMGGISVRQHTYQSLRYLFLGFPFIPKIGESRNSPCSPSWLWVSVCAQGYFHVSWNLGLWCGVLSALMTLKGISFYLFTEYREYGRFWKLWYRCVIAEVTM